MGSMAGTAVAEQYCCRAWARTEDKVCLGNTFYSTFWRGMVRREFMLVAYVRSQFVCSLLRLLKTLGFHYAEPVFGHPVVTHCRIQP